MNQIIKQITRLGGLRKTPPSPDQPTSAGSSLSSSDVTMASSVKPLPIRADLAWERAILRKSSLLISCLVILGGFFASAPPAFALFENAAKEACSGVTLNENTTDCPDRSSNVNNLLTTVINIFSVAIGFIAVIMIIISGLRYVTSAGDSNATSGAKNTLLYAVVGLVIVVLAQVIVRFVLSKTG